MEAHLGEGRQTGCCAHLRERRARAQSPLLASSTALSPRCTVLSPQELQADGEDVTQLPASILGTAQHEAFQRLQQSEKEHVEGE